MALPAHDDAGNLPPGRHEATLEEVRAGLVGDFPQSATRAASPRTGGLIARRSRSSLGSPSSGWPGASAASSS